MNQPTKKTPWLTLALYLVIIVALMRIYLNFGPPGHIHKLIIQATNALRTLLITGLYLNTVYRQNKKIRSGYPREPGRIFITLLSICIPPMLDNWKDFTFWFIGTGLGIIQWSICTANLYHYKKLHPPRW